MSPSSILFAQANERHDFSLLVSPCMYHVFAAQSPLRTSNLFPVKAFILAFII